MNKSVYISAIAVLFAGASLTSCSDFLDADNKTTGNQTADDVFQKNPELLLYSAYNKMYTVGTEVDMNEEGTDLYIPVRGKSASAFDQYTLNAENSDVYTYWKNLYQLVNYANGVVKYNAEATTPSASLDAEAKFLRCFAYYQLTQQWGEVPFITDYIGSAQYSYPRTDLNTIYDACIAELKSVYDSNALSTVAKRGTNVASPTQEAVALLRAKFFLAKGWDLSTTTVDAEAGTYQVSDVQYFDSARKEVEKIIPSSKTLPLTFEKKWSPTNDNNEEVYWAIQPDRTNGVGMNSLQNDYGNYYGECTATGYKNESSTHAQSEKALFLFSKGDTRYEATFMTTILNKGANGWGKTGYYAAYNNTSWKKVGYRYFPYYYTEAEAEATFDAANYSSSAEEKNNTTVKAYILGNTLGSSQCTVYTFKEDGSVDKKENGSYTSVNTQVAGGVCVKKFDDASSTCVKSNDDYRAIPQLQMSEAFLTAAEACLMSNDEAGALTYINAIRSRAYGSAYSGTECNLGSDMATALTNYANIYKYSPAGGSFKAIDIILDERAREMYAERTRWIDLRRTKQLTRYNKAYNPNLSSSVKNLRPIPSNERNVNSGITTQNEGY